MTFSLNHVRCPAISGSVTEAQTRAAFETFTPLGYLKDATFEMNTHLNTKVVHLIADAGVDGRHMDDI